MIKKIVVVEEKRMELDRFIVQMADNTGMIHALAEGISDEQARFKPDPDSWSILEVINHLLDEEREDFCVLLDLALHRPDEPRPRITPGAWVTDRRYNERDLGKSLQYFVAARDASQVWLRGLSSPDWDATYQAPWGLIRAGDIFAAWVAHDLLHTRQLVELHWAYTTSQLEPYSTEYAGAWQEKDE